MIMEVVRSSLIIVMGLTVVASGLVVILYG